MIPLGALAMLVVYVIVAGMIFYLLWWLVGYVGLPEPFNKVARVLIAVVAVVFLIMLLLSVVNGQPMFRA